MPELETDRAAVIADSLAYRDVLDRLREEGLTDGLPVIPPTAARVRMMLDGRDPGGRLGAVPPLCRPADLRAVAICAVMAGCRPAELDALVAATRALLHPELNVLGVATTTGNAALGVIIHSSVAARLGANAGANVLGPGNPVNATLGRAVALVVRFVGGAAPGVIDMATIGQPAKYGCALAESDPPPPWRALPLLRGLPDCSAVTVFAMSGVVEVVDTSSETGEGLLETLAAAIPMPTALAAGGDRLGGGEVLALIPPEWAAKLVDDGWSQQDVRTFLFERSAFPAERLPPSVRDQVTTASPWLMSAISPGHVVVMVTGGVGTKATLLPSWHGGSMSVTVPVGVPAAAADSMTGLAAAERPIQRRS